MKRRVFVQAGLGSLAVLLMGGTALSQQKKPISLWYEAASPENQENLKTLLVKPFNEAHPNEPLKIVSVVLNSTSNYASLCFPEAVPT